MKVNDLVKRNDGLLGIVIRVRKNGIIRVLMGPSWRPIDQMKRDWVTVNESR